MEDLEGARRKVIVRRRIAIIVLSSGPKGYCELYCDIPSRVVCSAHIDVALKFSLSSSKGI
jgi:hypothetical protein